MRAFASAVLAYFAAASAMRTPAPPPVAQYDVSWSTPTPFDGKNYADGMPTGNGRTVALAWANTSTGGLDFFVRSPLAQHTDSQLYTIAKVQVMISPNPWANSSYFNQTHHLEDGSISLSSSTVELRLTVDANSDAVLVTAAANDGTTPFSVAVNLASVRPTSVFNYTLDFACNYSTSQPDVFVNNPAPPLPNNVIALYHANSIAGGDVPFFAQMMQLQGLSSLLPAFQDPLDGRIFGVGITGGAGTDGSGAPLARVSSSQLASSAPAAAFGIQVAMHVDPNAKANPQTWLAGLAQAITPVPVSAQRLVASAAWWSDFWSRSYITFPPTPPPSARIGVFPCGGAISSQQAVTLNAKAQALTLPGGLCFNPSADGTSVYAGACTGQTWVLTPCTATGCTSGQYWVQNTATQQVLGLPGATCPWLDEWTADSPTGQYKNELWYYNSADGTLRTLCTNCADQCVTVVPQNQSTDTPSVASAQYARTRFIQAAQSRNVDVPIKFNGMLYMSQAQMPDARQWGPDSWWQNTRLPYGAMMAAGDFDTMRVVLDWAAGYVPLAKARTATLLPNESGIFFTETVDAFGLYQGAEYGCDLSIRPPGYPVWLEAPGDAGGWIRYDFGGNALGPEAGLMALDYYWHTLDEAALTKYLPIATETLAFYMTHYPNRTANGTFMLFPTQVLETYWCSWPPTLDNCCLNDMPQVAAVTALATRLLQLPANFLTPQQRTEYAAFLAILPPLPTQQNGELYAPAEIVSSGTHNSEVPELYAVHPFRLKTVGRTFVDPSVNLTIGQATWKALPLAQANTGWYYGIMDAALLGLSEEAFSMVMDRAIQPPPAGYRYPAFAQHYQDYEPSADHYANMMTAMQMMLLQSGEDGANGTIVLLPAWPCENDVSFKLWAPLNTTVEVSYVNGTLQGLNVQPTSRATSVHFANCVSSEAAEAAINELLGA